MRASSRGDVVLHTPKRLGHLGVIADLIDTTGLVGMIDSICGADSRMKVSHGECLKFVILAVFAGEHGLWRLSERMEPFDMATLMGDPGISLDAFYDVRFGRMLDAIWDTGTDRLHSSVSLSMIQSAQLDTSIARFDTTSLTFYGAFEEDMGEDWTPELDPTLNPLIIPERKPRKNRTPDGDGRDSPVVTYGYAKNKRDDLKQIVYGTMFFENVPVYGRAMDGSASDIGICAHFLNHLHTHMPDPRGQVFIADSKGWAPPSLECVRIHKLRMLSRLPRSTTLAKTVVQHMDETRASCYLKKYHKDRHRWSWITYQGEDAAYAYDVKEAVVDKDGKPRLDDHQKPITHAVRYTLPVRVVVCYSSELYRQKAETFGHIAKRETTKVKELIRRVARRSFACAADAQGELDALMAKQPMMSLTLAGSITRHETAQRRATRGRPAKDAVAPAVAVTYAIALTATPNDHPTNAIRLRRAATYVLIRNRLDDWEMSDTDMIAGYGKQWVVESGFSWLKSGAAINPMYVASPRRIQALLFIYSIALMLNALLQRNVRKYLKAHKLGLPYHRNKPSPHITSQFFYEIFRNVTSQSIQVKGVHEKIIHGLDRWTELALTAMSASPAAYKPIVETPRK